MSKLKLARNILNEVDWYLKPDDAIGKFAKKAKLLAQQVIDGRKEAETWLKANNYPLEFSSENVSKIKKLIEEEQREKDAKIAENYDADDDWIANDIAKQIREG